MDEQLDRDNCDGASIFVSATLLKDGAAFWN